MMKAHSTHPTWATAASSEPAAERTIQHADTLVGILADASGVRALRDALAARGIAVQQVDVLHGVDGLRRLDAHIMCDSPRCALRRWAGAIGLGPEVRITARHRSALNAGELLVVIHGVDRAGANEVSDIFVAHGGYCLQHYGRFSVAVLAA
jgi:hypothetical protein